MTTADTTAAITPMQQTARQLASIAATTVRLTGRTVTPERALDMAVNAALADAHDVAKRTGRWTGAMTSDEVAQWAFYGSVAADIRDNVTRPSTGPMREYALTMIAEYLRD